jgi:hypothetical protein
LAGMIFFAYWEIHTRSPMLDLAFFTRKRVFALSNLAAFIHYSTTFSLGFMLSLYLQYINDLS